jgi:hypothetical protein
MKIAAVILIALGVVALIYGGFTYTSRDKVLDDKVLDLGPIQATAEREHTLPMPPIAGAAMVAVGTVMLLIQKKRR